MKCSRYGLGKFGAASKVRRIDPKTGAVIVSPAGETSAQKKHPSSVEPSMVRHDVQQVTQ
jgi:hypothetical protein